MKQKRSEKPPLLAFGAWLTSLRSGKSRKLISRRLNELGTPLGGSTLAQYENGSVWSPDAAVLWGLSVIYRQRHERFVQLLRLNRAHPDVTSADELFARDVISAPHHGSDSSELRSKLLEYEEWNRELQTSIEQMSHVMEDAGELARQVVDALAKSSPKRHA